MEKTNKHRIALTFLSLNLFVFLYVFVLVFARSLVPVFFFFEETHSYIRRTMLQLSQTIEGKVNETKNPSVSL